MDASRDPDVLALRREFVAIALDGAISQAGGCIRMLQMEADKPAIAAFERTLSFVRQAADEMKLIRAAQVDELTAAAAAEYRADRGKAVA